MIFFILHPETPELTRRKIAIFWLPLFSTWLMMGVEGPFIAAVIARLAAAKFNLAAFGVAFSLGMFFESPIIMMLSAANVLVKDRRSYLKLRRFNNLLNLLITLAMLLVLLPPIFYLLTEGLIGLPPTVARLTRQATLLLLPWPAAIGYRRFYQGILIGNHLPRRVAYGTVVRLVAMAATALLLYLFSGAARRLRGHGRPDDRGVGGGAGQPRHGRAAGPQAAGHAAGCRGQAPGQSRAGRLLLSPGPDLAPGAWPSIP